LQILSSLNGKSHFVYTGVCIKTPYKKIVFCVETKVFFKNLSKDELIEYVKKYRPLDKAGAYGIQDGILVDKIEGSYDNVVGFPTKEVKEALIKLGVKVKE
jgi:septum formation protein